MKKLRDPDPENVINAEKKDDYTGDNASERSFFISLKFMKFGTRDDLQGAAFFFAIFFSFIWILVFCFQLKCETSSNCIDTARSWLENLIFSSFSVVISRYIPTKQSQDSL